MVVTRLPSGGHWFRQFSGVSREPYSCLDRAGTYLLRKASNDAYYAAAKMTGADAEPHEGSVEIPR